MIKINYEYPLSFSISIDGVFSQVKHVCVIFTSTKFFSLSAGTVEYTDCTSAEE